MKILIVSQYFWPENFSINKIASYLAEQGHDVDVVTGIPNYPQGTYFDGYGVNQNKEQNYKGTHIKRVYLKARGTNGGDKRLILNYLSYVFSAGWELVKRRNVKYDVSFVYAMSPISQAFPAMLLRLINHTPMCLYVGDLWPDTLFSHGIKGGIIKNLVTQICSLVYRNSDKVIIVNRSFYTPVLGYSEGKRDITYIPQSVDYMYKPVESKRSLRNELKLDDKAFIVTFAGNLGYAQSVMTVIKAAQLLVNENKVHFVFIGDGTLKKDCEAFCKENNLNNCYFIGSRNATDMPLLIADSDAMLITLKNQDNYNLTLPGRTQAFMACGKPIICSANGETARVINEAECGLVSQAEDANALSLNILSMMQMDKERLEDYSRNALAYSRMHYDQNKMLQDIERILSECKYVK